MIGRENPESSNNDGVYMPSQTLEMSSITCMAQEREVPHGNKGLRIMKIT
jgi:hypothetical protein